MRTKHGISLLLTLVLLVSVSGCEKDVVITGPPNIILITLDTMRADHLGCYGYDRPTSPNIDEFASNATLYTRALSSAPWTLPTHASLFTGLNPFEHGSHTYMKARRLRMNPLDEEHLTLAEVFENEGYATGAFVTNTGFLTERWQLDQGFQTYAVGRVRAPALNELAFEWLEEHGAKSFFLFLNYMDTHRPYNASQHAPFLKTAAVEDNGQAVQALYSRVMPAQEPVPEDLVRKVKDQYDTAVWVLDQGIGALVDTLKARGLYDRTMIVLTSDHGEFFGEHHLVEHSKDIYQEVIMIPLVIKNPGQRKGRVVKVPTTSTDIPSLVLSQCGERGAAYLDRFRDAPGNHEVIVENYYSRNHDVYHKVWGHRFNRVRTAIYDWPFKYIRSSDEEHELYNLDKDPGEAKNLVASNVELADRLSKRLKAFEEERERANRLVDQPPLTEEEIKQLKALGYIAD